jgi:hypothetical protein
VTSASESDGAERVPAESRFDFEAGEGICAEVAVEVVGLGCDPARGGGVGVRELLSQERRGVGVAGVRQGGGAAAGADDELSGATAFDTDVIHQLAETSIVLAALDLAALDLATSLVPSERRVGERILAFELEGYSC